MDEHPYTISDLAQEFDISTRTIRYYEEVGLLSPIRTPGGIRRYSRRDRARLKLILRGKRFGFSLEEIREMLDLFDADRTGRKQLQKALEEWQKRGNARKLAVARLWYERAFPGPKARGVTDTRLVHVRGFEPLVYCQAVDRHDVARLFAG
ncbi:MerR family transcriptional regulator [Calditerricola satsumensis]|uniref:HTH merR-type domain-containing protein n=1 Tax=Calditerricola satsumensis TaxID=373054 RepID=A0A8J3B9M3_9BACI|nr:MerR family transcriptional regulator [Calditerricola satsumensis]GGJ99095.1 hypothetical protein GCM10007043_11440 [Calditerricola satsumensis]